SVFVEADDDEMELQTGTGIARAGDDGTDSGWSEFNDEFRRERFDALGVDGDGAAGGFAGEQREREGALFGERVRIVFDEEPTCGGLHELAVVVEADLGNRRVWAGGLHGDFHLRLSAFNDRDVVFDR